MTAAICADSPSTVDGIVTLLASSEPAGDIPLCAPTAPTRQTREYGPED
jgi:hypothetical protein